MRPNRRYREKVHHKSKFTEEAEFLVENRYYLIRVHLHSRLHPTVFECRREFRREVLTEMNLDRVTVKRGVR